MYPFMSHADLLAALCVGTRLCGSPVKRRVCHNTRRQPLLKSTLAGTGVMNCVWGSAEILCNTALSTSLGNLEPRPQQLALLLPPSWHSPVILWLQVDHPLPCSCCLLCACIMLCDPGRGSCNFTVLPCVVWVKRRDSVRHSTRRQPLLQARFFLTREMDCSHGRIAGPDWDPSGIIALLTHM